MFRKSIFCYHSQPPQLAYLKMNLIYEYTGGTGLIFGKRWRNFIYLFGGKVHLFDKETDRNMTTGIWGIAYKPSKYGSIKLDFPDEEKRAL